MAHSTAVDSLKLASAAALARDGHYSLAGSLLESSADFERCPEVLDLLARVRVQQGMRKEAVRLWELAISLDPANASYRRALERLQKTRPLWLRRWLVAATGLASIAVVLCGAVHLWHKRTPPPVVQAVPPPGPQIPCPAVNGVSCSTETEAVAINFDKALFSSGTRFTRSGFRALSDLGEQFGRRGGPAAIEVIGRTDSRPVSRHSRYRDNAELGLARATAAISVLRAASGLPPDAFYAVSCPPPACAAVQRTDRPTGHARTVQIRLFSKRR
jgi:flagellar motor protein MotB